MGYVGWIGTFQGKKGTGKEKVFESLMVEELRELGAVLYCKTSVPMTLMSGETNNNIVGFCLNPKNRVLTAGGSSGGEGALIGLRGSPIGLGTDIGGVRVNDHICCISLLTIDSRSVYQRHSMVSTASDPPMAACLMKAWLIHSTGKTASFPSSVRSQPPPARSSSLPSQS